MRSKYTVAWLIGMALASIMLVVIAARADAQNVDPKDIVPRVSYGMLVGLTDVSRSGDVDYHSELFNGLGWEVGLNAVNKTDAFTIIGVSFIQLLQGSSSLDEVAYSWGFGVKFMGNALVGIRYNVFTSNPELRGGFATGDSSWDDNGGFVAQFVLPFNGGGALVNGYR